MEQRAPSSMEIPILKKWALCSSLAIQPLTDQQTGKKKSGEDGEMEVLIILTDEVAL